MTHRAALLSLVALASACTDSHQILSSADSGRRTAADAGPRRDGPSGGSPDSGPPFDGGHCTGIGDGLVREGVLGPASSTWNLPDVTVECPTIASSIEARYALVVVCNFDLAGRFDVVVEGDGSATELESPFLLVWEQSERDAMDCLDFDDGSGRSDARVNVRMGGGETVNVLVSTRAPVTETLGFRLTVTPEP